MPKKPITDDGKKGNYRRFIILSVLCFVIGVWLISFPIFNFPWTGTDLLRLMMDALALIAGAIMMALAFTLWRMGVS
jgi:hypothetical protein